MLIEEIGYEFSIVRITILGASVFCLGPVWSMYEVDAYHLHWIEKETLNDSNRIQIPRMWQHQE